MKSKGLWMSMLLAGMTGTGWGQAVTPDAKASGPWQQTVSKVGDAFSEAEALVKITEVRRQAGPILIVETKGRLVPDFTVVLVGSEANKHIAEGLLQAVFPAQMDDKGQPASADAPRVLTTDEYLAGLERVDKTGMGKDGTVLDSERRLHALLRRFKLTAELGKNFAVVYRYVRAK